MPRCKLDILVTPGAAPIRCRRCVWAEDPGSGVCASCHPRGREQFIEDVIRGFLTNRDGIWIYKREHPPTIPCRGAREE